MEVPLWSKDQFYSFPTQSSCSSIYLNTFLSHFAFLYQPILIITSLKNKRNAVKSTFLLLLNTAGDRNRTGTVFLQQDFKSCASASSATPANQWAEVDSNHRSNLQQIYSLSPLATRESAHLSETPQGILTESDYITLPLIAQPFFRSAARFRILKSRRTAFAAQSPAHRP